MATTLQTRKLGELVTFKTGKLDSNAAVVDGDYPFFTCSQETLRTNTYSFDTECVLLAGNNANGIFPLKYFKGKFDAYQRTYIVRPRDTNVLSTKFLYYALRVKLSELRSFSTGAATKFLTLAILNETEIQAPPLPVQQRISGILSAYDELIENNQRRTRILEAMAHALYREWFVHFRFPEHENHARVVSPLGQIPRGWELKRLGDISSYINRGITPRYDEKGDTLVINQKCVRDQRLSLEPSRKQSKAIPSEKQVCFGDVLINSTGVGTLGRVAQVYETLENCTVDTHVTIARASHDIDLDFYGCCLLSLQETFQRLGIGATGQTELSRAAISDIELVVPPAKLQRKFGEAVRGMRLAAMAYGKQIQNLRRTRDLLLPRLLSGQIALGGADEDGLTEGIASPAPVQVSPRPNTSSKVEVATPDTVLKLRDASRPIGTVERDEVLCTIRKVFGDGAERDRDVALRDIAYALGYQRLGPRIREALSGDFIAAVRRGIVVNAGGNYRLGFRSFADCPRDALKDAFESSIGRTWIVREDAIRAFARWAGFGRVGDVIDQTARSLINGLIREGRVETDGPELIRRT